MQKILVVDNSPTMLKIMTSLLKRKGFQVKTAADGLSALAQLKTYTPDVIFIDLIMPNISGEKLCWAIRSMASMKNVKIVILSAIAAEEQSKVEEIDADAWIAKTAPEKMSGHIYSVLNQFKQAAATGLSHKILGTEDLQQRQITRELLSYRRHLEVILGSMDEGIVELTPMAEIVYANRFAVALLGVAEEKLLALDFRTLFTGAAREIVTTALKRVEHTPPHLTLEPPLNIDGRTVLLKMLPVNDAGGQSVIVILNDISEKKHAQDALQQSQAKYKTILESIEEGFYETDLAGNFTFVDESVCQILGYPCRELLGLNNRAYTSPQEAARIYQVFNRAYHTGESAKAKKFEIITRKGDKKNVEISAYLIRGKEGQLTGFRGVVRDMTARLQLEREKKILEDQLRQAQKMEAVGTLAGGIAHDFNNVLQAISGYTELLMMNADKEVPEYDYNRAIQKAVANGSALIKRLMIFSRRAESELRPLNLNQEIFQMAELLKRTLPKMIDIELRLADDLRTIKADSVQLEQILANMGVNARDAMPEGGHLVLATENVSLDEHFSNTHLGATPGQFVRLTITDTGHGMDKQTQSRIFEPFFTTKHNGNGTGLGLAMVYGIVKSHKGYITCESECGQGTTFSIYFPVVYEKPGINQTREEAEPRHLGGSETILLVDDDKAILASGKKILEAHGYTIFSARTGEEALQVFQSERSRIDLVLLDLNMPGIGGYKCLDEILSIDPQAVVMLTSGYLGAGMERKCLKAGAKGFIGKPHLFDRMLAKIRQVIDKTEKISTPG